jgi:hypothetical protein
MVEVMMQRRWEDDKMKRGDGEEGANEGPWTSVTNPREVPGSQPNDAYLLRDGEGIPFSMSVEGIVTVGGALSLV